jgi:hypothetical protein
MDTVRVQGLATHTEGNFTFVHLPVALQREAGTCRCGYCDGNAKWDTLVVPHDGSTTWTCHYPKFPTRRK